MATKIRLQRHGRKGYAYYHIVVADSRAKRDGRCVERIGSYNPNTNPATIDLNFERALYWMNVGAQPTDTARSILSREGVLLMKHLELGVKKGALTQEQANLKLQMWKDAKKKSLDAVVAKDEETKNSAKAARHEEEVKINKAKAEALAKKLAEQRAAAQEQPAEGDAEGVTEVAPDAE